MKSLSKSLKTVFVFIALIFAATLFAISPISHTINYNAEVTSTSGKNVLKVSQVPNKTKIDLSKKEKFLIPFATTSDNYTVRVIDGSGISHDYNVVPTKNDYVLSEGGSYTGIDGVASKTQDDFVVVAEDGKNYLTLKSQATNSYKILYIQRNDSTGRVYYSNAYTVDVVGVDYEIDFRKIVNNSGTMTITEEETLFPTYVKVNSGHLDIAPVYAHPIYAEDEEVKFDQETWDELTPRFTFNGETYENNTVDGKQLFEKIEGGYRINYLIKGNYAVEYSKPDANNSPIATKKIEVLENFVNPTASDITVTRPQLPAGVELGDKDVKFEKPVLSYNFNYSDKNVVYTIESITVSKVSGSSNISFTLTNNETSFDFTTEYLKEHFNIDTTYEALAGTYSVKFRLRDAYGNIIERSEPWGKIGISSRPNIYLTYDYDAFGSGDKEGQYIATVDSIDTTVNTEIKSEYGYSELLFPAVFAEDKISNYDDLLIERYIRSSTGYNYYIDNVRVDSTNYKYVPVTQSSGSYRVNYALKTGEDESGKDTWSWEFEENNETKLKEYYERLSNSQYLKLFEDGDASKFENELNKNYTLYYRVYVKNPTPGATSTSNHRNQSVYEVNSSYYTFKIVNNTSVTTTDSKLAINITSDIVNNQQVKAGDKLTINVNATDNNDVRLDNILYYYTGSATNGKDLATNISNVYSTLKPLSLDTPSLGKESTLKSKAFLDAMKACGYTTFGVVDKNSSTEFELELNDDFITAIGASAKSFNIVAATRNDRGVVATSASKTLVIANTTETSAPTITDVKYDTNAANGGTEAFWTPGNAANKVGQNVVVTLPTVTFDDGADGDDVLGLNVQYYVVPNGKAGQTIEANNFYNNPYISPYDYYFDGNSIIGGTITTNEVGTYYVVYSAIDDAGNVTVTHFTFEVESTTEPTITVNLTGNGFSGSWPNYTCDVNTAIGFESVVTDPNDPDNKELSAKTTVKVTSNGLRVSRDSSKPNTYIFEDYGEYTVTVSAEYNGYTVTQTCTIKVEFPTMSWSNLNTFTAPSYADENEKVILNTLIAEHGNYSIKPLEVTYQGPSDTEPQQATYENGKWTFTPTRKGTYTVTYTARSTASKNNELTKTIEIKVGDNKAPDINVYNESTLTQDIVLDGEIEYTVKLSTDYSNRILIIEAKQNGEVIYTWNSYADKLNDHKNLRIVENDNKYGVYDNDYGWANLKVELTGDNVTSNGSEEVKEDGVTYTVTKYTINGQGKYALTLSCSDSNGNTGTRTLNFNVTNKSEATEKNDNVVGIVLIVISVVVLLGVILFFLFTGKKGGSGKSNSKKQTTKQKEVSDTNSNQSDDDAVEGEVE